MKSEEFYESLDTGIADVVRRLHSLGYETTDSGDGTADMECAIGVPNVHVLASSRADLVGMADQLLDHFPDWSIQAHYSPNDGIAGIMMLQIEETL